MTLSADPGPVRAPECRLVFICDLPFGAAPLLPDPGRPQSENDHIPRAASALLGVRGQPGGGGVQPGLPGHTCPPAGPVLDTAVQSSRAPHCPALAASPGTTGAVRGAPSSSGGARRGADLYELLAAWPPRGASRSERPPIFSVAVSAFSKEHNVRGQKGTLWNGSPSRSGTNKKDVRSDWRFLHKTCPDPLASPPHSRRVPAAVEFQTRP